MKTVVISPTCSLTNKISIYSEVAQITITNRRKKKNCRGRQRRTPNASLHFPYERAPFPYDLSPDPDPDLGL